MELESQNLVLVFLRLPAGMILIIIMLSQIISALVKVVASLIISAQVQAPLLTSFVERGKKENDSPITMEEENAHLIKIPMAADIITLALIMIAITRMLKMLLDSLNYRRLVELLEASVSKELCHLNQMTTSIVFALNLFVWEADLLPLLKSKLETTKSFVTEKKKLL